MSDTIAEKRGTEYAFPIALAALIFLLGTVPYAYGYLITPDDKVFMDFVGRGTPGANGYFAFAKQAYEGLHLMENKMTPEPTRRDYFNLEWWIFGKMARWMGLSLVDIFHVTRAMIVLFYVCALYRLISLCTDSLFQRRLVVALVCLGSGLGWLIWIANRAGMDLTISRDLKGVGIPGYLVNKPHFILGAAFALMAQVMHLRAYQTGQLRFFAYSGLMAALHSLVRPYGIPETHALWAGFAVLVCIREGRWAWERARGPLLAMAVHAPVFAYFLYYAWTGSLGSPDWSRVPGHIIEYVFWIGWPFALLVAGMPWLLRLRQLSDAHLLLLTWILLAWFHCNAYPYTRGGQEAAFYSFPVVTVFFSVCVLMPRFWQWWRERPALLPWVPFDFSKPRNALLAAIVLVVASMPTTVIIYRDYFITLRYGHPDWTFYISKDLYHCLQWVDKNVGEEDVILASLRASQFIPRVANSKVVTGHDFLTTKYYEKNPQVERFFYAESDEDFKRGFLREHSVDYLLYSEFEQEMHGMRPENFPWLKPAHTVGKVTIYKVIP